MNPCFPASLTFVRELGRKEKYCIGPLRAFLKGTKCALISASSVLSLGDDAEVTWESITVGGGPRSHVGWRHDDAAAGR